LFKNKFTAPTPLAKGNAKGEREIYSSFRKLKNEDGMLVFSKDGKVVRMRVRDLKKEGLE